MVVISNIKMKPRVVGGGVKFLSRYLIGGGITEHASLPSSCKSHKLMLRSQLIASSATGTYNYLPLGMRALQKLCGIVDEEMEKIGCLKVGMSSLSASSPWKKSGRWDAFGDELMKLNISNTEHCLSPTHEEAITSMVASFGRIPLSSLPLKLYQISTKYRDEPRPRFGLLRCREFLMKDLYTFDTNIGNAKITYNEVCQAYENVFSRLGLIFIKALSLCGNIGGEMSHEYLLPASIGEDKVCVSGDGTARNFEYKRKEENPTLTKDMNAIEIGHTFLLGTIYSKCFEANFLSANSSPSPLFMGCYGLGVSRILAACIEVMSKDDTILWPHEISPFKVCLIPPKKGSKEHLHMGDIEMGLFADLNNSPNLLGDVIIDDRSSRTIGKRIKECELIGFPVIVILGKGLLESTPKAEIIFTSRHETVKAELSDIVTLVSSEFN